MPCCRFIHCIFHVYFFSVCDIPNSACIIRFCLWYSKQCRYNSFLFVIFQTVHVYISFLCVMLPLLIIIRDLIHDNGIWLKFYFTFCLRILHFVCAYYTLSTHITLCMRILHFVYAYYILYTHITLCIRILHFVYAYYTLYTYITLVYVF